MPCRSRTVFLGIAAPWSDVGRTSLATRSNRTSMTPALLRGLPPPRPATATAPAARSCFARLPATSRLCTPERGCPLPARTTPSPRSASGRRTGFRTIQTARRSIHILLSGTAARIAVTMPGTEGRGGSPMNRRANPGSILPMPLGPRVPRCPWRKGSSRIPCLMTEHRKSGAVLFPRRTTPGSS